MNEKDFEKVTTGEIKLSDWMEGMWKKLPFWGSVDFDRYEPWVEYVAEKKLGYMVMALDSQGVAGALAFLRAMNK